MRCEGVCVNWLMRVPGSEYPDTTVCGAVVVLLRLAGVGRFYAVELGVRTGCGCDFPKSYSVSVSHSSQSKRMG